MLISTKTNKFRRSPVVNSCKLVKPNYKVLPLNTVHCILQAYIIRKKTFSLNDAYFMSLL